MHLHWIGRGMKNLITCLEAQPRLMVCQMQLTKGVYSTQSEVQIVEVNDDEVILETQEQCRPLHQNHVFSHVIEKETHVPYISLDTPKTKACKLSSVQSKPNKIIKKTRK
jgi:hypothetical protein